MNLDELGDNAKKENLLAIMVKMSKVDGEVHANEMMWILQLGFSLGMTEEEIRNITINDSDSLLIPTSEQERMSILVYLVFVIKVDDEITEEEKETLHHFGLKLGFNHLMVANILRVVEANLGKRLPPDAILTEVRKYLN
ncbi:MAG: hypothetical protein P1U56_12460 [Saprospiraceae bacterium]|nr:hypothetical protein [Saprospiraceae bacterium]